MIFLVNLHCLLPGLLYVYMCRKSHLLENVATLNHANCDALSNVTCANCNKWCPIYYGLKYLQKLKISSQCEDFELIISNLFGTSVAHEMFSTNYVVQLANC